MIKLKNLLLESKQSIINLGYPEIIAKILYEKFGNKSFLLSRWFKEYHSNAYTNGKDWWRIHFGGFGNMKINDYVDLYYSTKSPEEYVKMLRKFEFEYKDVSSYDEQYLKEAREDIKKEIEKMLFNDIFFVYYSIIVDIISGKLKDLNPYEKMTFQDAAIKYEEKRIFGEMTPIKTYKNGFKWINVGKKCHLLGHFMKNCGSAGVMSTDKDRTLIGLFDTNNKPHVVVTYSPNEKRISGDEGVGSTEVKLEYHNYIVDLAETLNVNFDTDRTKSKFLKLKYLLKNKTKNIKQLKAGKSLFDEYFKITIGSNIYYSNGYDVVSKDDIQKAINILKTNNIKLKYRNRNISDIFNHYNKEILKNTGLQYVGINNFVRNGH